MEARTSVIHQSCAAHSQLPLRRGWLTRASTSGRQLLKYSRRVSFKVRAQSGLGEEPQSEDDGLSKELEKYKSSVDPQRKTKLAAHLNLLWSVSEVSWITHQPLLLLW